MHAVFFVLLFILQIKNAFFSRPYFLPLVKLAATPGYTQDNEAVSDNNIDATENMATQFPNGIVPYSIDPESYDNIVTNRIRAAMDTIEASSCVVFSQITGDTDGSWIYFTNSNQERNCVHEPMLGDHGKIVIVIGYDCMSTPNLLHSVLHALGFKDEVSHPHRDQYVRILWENIQPVYRPLFRIQLEDVPHKLVEYDPLSIMHFHDGAYSSNGGPTIIPRMPGLNIAPSDTLSQLDVMKLRLWFGHECNKRKVGDLVENCKNVLYSTSNSTKLSNTYSESNADDGKDYDESQTESND